VFVALRSYVRRIASRVSSAHLKNIAGRLLRILYRRIALSACRLPAYGSRAPRIGAASCAVALARGARAASDAAHVTLMLCNSARAIVTRIFAHRVSRAAAWNVAATTNASFVALALARLAWFGIGPGSFSAGFYACRG